MVTIGSLSQDLLVLPMVGNADGGPMSMVFCWRCCKRWSKVATRFVAGFGVALRRNFPLVNAFGFALPKQFQDDLRIESMAAFKRGELSDDVSTDQ